MPEQWDSYFCNVNDKLASVCLDLGIRDRVPDKSRPYLLWVWVYMQAPRPDGLSSHEEAEVLWKLEDKLTAALEVRLDAIFVGRITTDGRREFYYYLSQPPGDGSEISRALHSFPEYEFDWGKKHDPGWEQYFSVLCPSEEELETIKNERVLETLEEHGDRLEQEREVRHWAYFKTARDRETFVAGVRDLGYAVQSTSEDTKEPYPFQVCIGRTDRVDRDSINEIVFELFRLAKATNGLYDGWETEVVPSTD